MEVINTGMQLVFSAVKAYTSLQELMSNFRTIIVPEAANSFLKNNHSVIFIAETIKELADNLGPSSLKELCQAHEDAVTSRSEVTDEVRDTTEKLKQIIDRLIQPETSASTNATASSIDAEEEEGDGEFKCSENVLHFP